MGFKLGSIVPWGRSYEEYIRMFSLTKADLTRRIIGCADGPASFNAELSRQGGQIVSIDPVYRFNVDQIRSRISETYEEVLAQTAKNRGEFVWDTLATVEELGRLRLSAMERFLSDFPSGKREGRYIAGELPRLPFQPKQFRLALVSHFLFLYSDHLAEEFHFQSIREMLRVADEVRIFPLLTLGGAPSPYVDTVRQKLAAVGYDSEKIRVAYEFQRGGNEMLVVTGKEG